MKLRVSLNRPPTNVESAHSPESPFIGCPDGQQSHTLPDMTDAHAAQLRISRVLIADDRVRTRRALSAVLAMHPCIKLVGEAADGETAVAEVDRLRPDVVIMDLVMPRLDGIAATVQIKARWPWIRVVAHSLYLEFRGAAVAAGADAFVAKGAPVFDLFEALIATSDRR